MSRAADKRARLTRLLTGLRKMYGDFPRPKRPRGAALDTLIEAMLAQNTSMSNARRGYRMLRRRFSSWTKVMNAPVEDVQREIAICGLSRMRARRLQALLQKIKSLRGALNIDFLAQETPDDALNFLLDFYGIGPRTATFTLLFGCGHVTVQSPLLRFLAGLVR